MKSRRPYWIYLFSQIKEGPGPPSTPGYADDHRVQNDVSIANTEGGICAFL